MVEVTNLATGEKREYTCSPQQAVVCADQQDKGNWCTWTYPWNDAHTSSSGLMTFCGDWAAPTGLKLNHPNREGG